ncbi:MAG: NHLP family bacteriocin export ABC transporter peptidase/permease/ATPase subunit [Proteobacteria bacterium]|nr:NHLP family bacteriocin export ABC transporter peptidase/permease/ATPase subunit [Pseudomonadota bacterium]
MDEPKKVWSNKRVKTPTVLQMEAVECGAASLAMILAYFHRFVPLEKLRIECGISRDGSKASNILKAARKYGFEAKGYKKEPDGLREFELPMIVFWNFNHFVVLEGIKNGRAFLNDPAVGPRVISVEEFDQSFTGVVLVFKPTEDFQKGGEKKSLFRALRQRFVGTKSALTYVVLAGLFLVIPGLVIPIFSKIFVDNVLVDGMEGWLRPLLLAMGLTALIRGGLTWLQEYYLLRFETKLALTSSSKFFRHVFRLPVEFFAQRFGGEVGDRVLLNDKVAHLLSGELATNIINLAMIMFYAILMLQYDIVLTLVGIFIALLNLAVLKYVSRKRTDLNMRLQQEAGKMIGTAMNGLQMIETLKATGSESDFFSQWSGYQAKVLNAQQQLAVSSQLLSLVPPFLASLNTVVILGIGGARVMDGYLSMGMLVAFQSLMSSFMQPVNHMVNLGSTLQETQADMNRLDDVQSYPVDNRFSIEQGLPPNFSDQESKQEDSSAVKLSGNLSLNNITYGYSRMAPPLIENFSMNLKPGMRVALVGGSGSGKSTIAKLITGLYESWEGEILFDGKKMNEIPRDIFCNSLAMVDQDIFMFEESISSNLAMWDESIPESTIIHAAKDACIHPDIAMRAGGYSSNVEEGGNNFSGGQRQRLEIARALVNNPTILVLDEATSALDPHTEKIVDDNLRRRGCTCIIVAHRLSTIRDCDEIIVLDQGKVLQRGTHEEMRNAEGPYAELIGEQ